jgi:SH3-like domain-containing protein
MVREVVVAVGLALGAVLLAPLGPGLSGPVMAAEKLGVGPVSGLPLPRFVSLKSDRVNVRGGPTREHEVTWIYTRAGLPVEIVAEYDNWRRIRDWDGAEGWVFHSMLSGKRTAIVARPRDRADVVPLRARADAEAGLVAKLQPGVVAQVRVCSGDWCRIRGEGFDGWMPQERLFGVYPKEQVED